MSLVSTGDQWQCMSPAIITLPSAATAGTTDQWCWVAVAAGHYSNYTLQSPATLQRLK